MLIIFALTCINGGNAFHQACAARDWSEKLTYYYIVETRVECVKQDRL